MKTLANLSVSVLFKARPVLSKVLSTLGTGNILVTTQAPIFHNTNCKDTSACEPPNIPADTVLIEMGFPYHSSYNKSITFFKLDGKLPLYSGVMIIIPSEFFILFAKSKTSSVGF